MPDSNRHCREQLASLNKQLGHRLASLDRGERADPSAVLNRIKTKSQLRRTISTARTAPPRT
jgi:hypothetical protein